MKMSWMLALALFFHPAAALAQASEVPATASTECAPEAEFQKLQSRVLTLEMALAALAREPQTGLHLPEGLPTD